MCIEVSLLSEAQAHASDIADPSTRFVCHQHKHTTRKDVETLRGRGRQRSLPDAVQSQLWSAKEGGVPGGRVPASILASQIESLRARAELKGTSTASETTLTLKTTMIVWRSLRETRGCCFLDSGHCCCWQAFRRRHQQCTYARSPSSSHCS